MKEEMQAVAFQIIATVGEAKSLFIEAMYASREGDFELAQKKLDEGSEVFAKAHSFHFDIVQKEASGDDLPFSVMFLHAEDQLLSTETIQLMAQEIILLRKERV